SLRRLISHSAGENTLDSRRRLAPAVLADPVTSMVLQECAQACHQTCDGRLPGLLGPNRRECTDEPTKLGQSQARSDVCPICRLRRAATGPGMGAMVAAECRQGGRVRAPTRRRVRL